MVVDLGDFFYCFFSNVALDIINFAFHLGQLYLLYRTTLDVVLLMTPGFGISYVMLWLFPLYFVFISCDPILGRELH